LRSFSESTNVAELVCRRRAATCRPRTARPLRPPSALGPAARLLGEQYVHCLPEALRRERLRRRGRTPSKRAAVSASSRAGAVDGRPPDQLAHPKASSPAPRARSMASPIPRARHRQCAPSPSERSSTAFGLPGPPRGAARCPPQLGAPDDSRSALDPRGLTSVTEGRPLTVFLVANWAIDFGLVPDLAELPETPRSPGCGQRPVRSRLRKVPVSAIEARERLWYVW
jgi:hypothetical protein